MLLLTVTPPQLNSVAMAKHTQDASGSRMAEADIKGGASGLDDLIQHGARMDHPAGNRGGT